MFRSTPLKYLFETFNFFLNMLNYLAFIDFFLLLPSATDPVYNYSWPVLGFFAQLTKLV